MNSKIILFELNEVPWRIVDAFCGRHPHSFLARHVPQMRQFETLAADEGHLSPWITWPTLHRGIPSGQHGIHSFGQPLDEIDHAYPTLWQLLAEAGVPTGVFGSLHSYSQAERRRAFAFYVPDTFAAGSECFPDHLEAFQRFNLSMVQDSPRNVASQVRWGPAMRMLAQAPGLGLKPRTLLDAAGQLVRERLQPARRVRRRTYQALLAFDIFFRQLVRRRPALATFFTNHVASAMHRYWAARFPEDYDQFGYDADWVATYCDEIDFALLKLDRCLARLARFVRRQGDYQLWITTSMGQAATTAESVQRQLYITDLERFMAALRVPAGAWQRRPAMAPDTSILVELAQAERFAAGLQTLQIDGRPVEWSRSQQNFFSVRLGHPDLHRRPVAVEVAGQPSTLAELGLANVEIEDRSYVTAYHIPQGMLLIHDPRQSVRSTHRTQISTLDIAPSILRHFEVAVPPYMQRSRISAAA